MFLTYMQFYSKTMQILTSNQSFYDIIFGESSFDFGNNSLLETGLLWSILNDKSQITPYTVEIILGDSFSLATSSISVNVLSINVLLQSWTAQSHVYDLTIS